jgi:Flp pilus assembly protein TadB
MPFLLFAVVTLLKPDYFNNEVVRNHPITMPAFILGLTLLAVGNVIIYRMVHFKV